MHFLLVALKVVYVLTILRPATNNEEETLDDICNRQKWDMDDEICKGTYCLFEGEGEVSSAPSPWRPLDPSSLNKSSLYFFP